MDALQQEILDMGKRARKAALALANLTTAQKNAILLSMADGLVTCQAAILEANTKDLKAAEENGLNTAMIDRLRLDAPRIEAIADGIRQVAALPDPVGETLDE
ncbi:MAG: gamma-glutamyl-phosphate reductase, partial [Verrucomicrobiales bacterium]